MDIYSYLNSKDVAEYCRSLDYKFDAIEAAFIVNACRRISQEEKLRLFQEIIDTMPDEAINERERILKSLVKGMKMETDSFHKALSEYIAVMRKSMAAFLSSGSDSVYTWEYYRRDWHDSNDTKRVYSSFEKAKEALMQELQERCEPDDDGDRENISEYTGFIYKRRIDSDEYGYAAVRENGIITELYDSKTDEESHWFCQQFFESIWVKIPVPFKKGDLLYGTNPHTLYDRNIGKEPMVFASCCYDGLDENEPRNQRRLAGWDASDMTAWGYWLCDDGRLYEECMHSYYDLEYYRGEIKGNVRVLKALSAQMKGDIDAHMLMIAYDAVQREREMNAVFPGWDYLPECYEKMGIADIHEKYELWKKYDREESEND